MALHVGLVHTVQTIEVEHGIHLRVAWIVACTHCVDVGLLHEFHIAQHCRHVDSMAKERMDVLGVYTLEVFALAIDVDKVATLLNRTEAVACGEHHLLVAVVHLAHNNCIEIRMLSRPRLQAREAFH